LISGLYDFENRINPAIQGTSKTVMLNKSPMHTLPELKRKLKKEARILEMNPPKMKTITLKRIRINLRASKCHSKFRFGLGVLSIINKLVSKKCFHMFSDSSAVSSSAEEGSDYDADAIGSDMDSPKKKKDKKPKKSKV